MGIVTMHNYGLSPTIVNLQKKIQYQIFSLYGYIAPTQWSMNLCTKVQEIHNKG